MVSLMYGKPVVKTLARMPTWPEVKSIKAVRVQVISDTVAPPSLSSTGIRSVAFSVGPAYPQVGGLPIYKVVHLIYHQLKIPLLILSWSFSHTQEDVRPHTRCENRGKRSLFGLKCKFKKNFKNHLQLFWYINGFGHFWRKKCSFRY